jgi:hypothetical protein
MAHLVQPSHGSVADEIVSEEQVAAGPQESAYLAECLLVRAIFYDVIQHVEGGDAIKGGIGKLSGDTVGRYVQPKEPVSWELVGQLLYGKTREITPGEMPYPERLPLLDDKPGPGSDVEDV